MNSTRRRWCWWQRAPLGGDSRETGRMRIPHLLRPTEVAGLFQYSLLTWRNCFIIAESVMVTVNDGEYEYIVNVIAGISLCGH